MSLLIIIFSSAVAALCGFAIGYSAGKKQRLKDRRGVYKTDIVYDTEKWASEHTWATENDVVIIVKELDRVANQSQVKIVCIDHDDARVKKWAKKNIGNWLPTNKIKWEFPPVSLEQEDEVSKIIKTPLSELVELDNIRDI